MRLVIIIAILIVTFSNLLADETATTSSGKKVIIKDDGTWEAVAQQPLPDSQQFDFRKTRWGMTKSEVRATESNKVISDDGNILIYDGKVSGFPCAVGYVFKNDVFRRGVYIFTQEHTNKSDYISDFLYLRALLTSKYEDPVEYDHVWKNELYRNDSEQWGMAVSIGHLYYYANWELPTTDIKASLRGDNYKITMKIEYSDNSDTSNPTQDYSDDL